MWGFHLLPRIVDCHITIGSSGAVASFTGPGVAAVTHDGTGIYKIQMQDNYASIYSLIGAPQGAVSGSAIDPNGAVVGSPYEITALGTTTSWATAGIPSGITPAVGMRFALAAQPTAGDGTVKLVVPSQIVAIQPLGKESAGMLNKQPFQALAGGYVQIMCVGATDSTHPALIAANPASGEVIHVRMLFNDSQVQ